MTKNIELIALCIFDTPKQKYAIYEWGGSSCMAVFRRKIIEEKQLRFVSEREYISEDYIFNFEFYLHSNKIGYLDSTFYHYRINPNSLTRKINLDAIKKAEKYARHIEK